MFDPNGQLIGHPLVMDDSVGRCKMGCDRWSPLFEHIGEGVHVTNMVLEPICQDVLAWKDDTCHDFQASDVSDGRICCRQINMIVEGSFGIGQ